MALTDLPPQKWIIVVTNEGTPGPSVVGPFDSSEKAAAFGKSIEAYVSKVSLATLNPIPEAYK